MRKRFLRLSALVLCLLLLCGCGSEAALGNSLRQIGSAARSLREIFDGVHGDEIPRFSEMVYERPSVEEFQDRVQAAMDAINEGVSYNKLTGLLDKCYDSYYHFDTMYCIADIRNSQDMTDSYYSAEYSWCDENYYLLQKSFEELFRACAACEHGPKLEEQYFWPGFCEDYSSDSQSYFYEEALSLMQQESELLSRYRSITAAPTVEVDGQIYDYNEYIQTLEGAEYNRVNMLYYRQYNEQLSDVYIDLVRVRTQLAKELGFESYEQMQYLYTFERDYTPEEAEEYFRQVREHVVPVYKKAMADMIYTDFYYEPVGEEELLSTVGAAMGQMGEEISEAFDFMIRYELYDVKESRKKLNLSYQSYLTEYDAPFLFMYPYGDTEDMLTLAHEFGHYVDAYTNYNAYETIDLSECYSQAMEYLMLFYLEDVLDEAELENLRRIKMFDTIDLYVQQCSFAEFESRVYEMGADNLSAEILNELSLQLAKDYGYYELGYDDYYAMSWSDIPHFFESPFYVVSYPISNDVALQIYELEKQQSGAGVDMFCTMLPRQYEGLMDSALAAGLSSPFEKGRLEQIAQDVGTQLFG